MNPNSSWCGISRSEALDLCTPSSWHDELLAAYSEFGFCHNLSDIPVHPLLLDASFLEKAAAQLRDLMDLARYLALEHYRDRAPIRADHQIILDAYRNAPRRPRMGRPDCILSGGALKVLEINIGSGMGGIQEVDKLVQAYRGSRMGSVPDCHIQSPLDSQIDFIKTQLELIERKSVCVVPLSDFNRFYLDQSDRLAAEIQKRLGVQAKTVFPEALRGGSWLTDGQNEYGLFYQDACFLHEPVILDGMRQALLSARTTSTVVLGDPLDVGVDDKGALALVSEHLDGSHAGAENFSDLHEIVPWTRLMNRRSTTAFGEEVLLAPFVLKNKDRLVLKRCGSHVGKHVYIGSRTEDDIWRDIVTRADPRQPNPEDWVVQEFVSSDQLPFWFRSDEEKGAVVLQHRGATLGPFIFGDMSNGWLVRIQGEGTPSDAVLALPTDGNIGITTVAAVTDHGNCK